jgi:hypothetical protein
MPLVSGQNLQWSGSIDCLYAVVQLAAMATIPYTYTTQVLMIEASAAGIYTSGL